MLAHFKPARIYLPSRLPSRPPATSPPHAALVDHPGVWEKAGHAYLNEVLVSRCGIPAALAIVLADIVRRLLLLVRGARAAGKRACPERACLWCRNDLHQHRTAPHHITTPQPAKHI